MTRSKPTDSPDRFRQLRLRMVKHQLESRGIADPRVLATLASVPREEFVPPEHEAEAYHDGPIPIGPGQTISQPYTVAMMCEALQLSGVEKVLEIGTGSGYAACVLGQLAREVHTIERIPELAAVAAERLHRLGLDHVHVHVGDGSLGLVEEAPFDAIVVTAAGPDLPRAYAEQLAEGGRIVMPIGRRHDQQMCRYTKRQGTLHLEELGNFCFVPLIGQDAW